MRAISVAAFEFRFSASSPHSRSKVTPARVPLRRWFIRCINHTGYSLPSGLSRQQARVLRIGSLGGRFVEPRYDVAFSKIFLTARASHLQIRFHEVVNNV